MWSWFEPSFDVAGSVCRCEGAVGVCRVYVVCLPRVVGSWWFVAYPTDDCVLAYLFGSLFVVTLIVGAFVVALLLSF